MPLYFAYGSNMDLAAMASRCPASRPIGRARLPRHRPVVMREGYASIARDPRRDVHGLLWELALADVPALDRYEDVAGGLYVKRQISVLTKAGPRRALCYLGSNAGPGTPRPGYLEGVLEAGRAAGLPPAYLAELAALGRPVRPDRPSAAAAPPVRHLRPSPLEPRADYASPAWRWEP